MGCGLRLNGNTVQWRGSTKHRQVHARGGRTSFKSNTTTEIGGVNRINDSESRFT